MNQEDLSWVSGIYEGEGTIFNYDCPKCANGRGIRAGIVNNDLSMLNETLRILRIGNITKTKKNRKNTKFTHKTDNWNKVRLFCRLIYPLMRTEYKRWQMEQAWRDMKWSERYLQQSTLFAEPVDPYMIDLNWVAGIYEGEGWTTVMTHNKNKNKLLMVGIGNNDISMLGEVKKVIGYGSIIKGSNPKEEQHHQSWKYTIFDKYHARMFCKAIYPMLRSDYKKWQMEERWKEMGWKEETLKEHIVTLGEMI